MVIKKEYNIEGIIFYLTNSISESIENDKYNVKVPLHLANDILDVLNETLRREQKNQTLDSALEEVEEEEEAKTNEKKLDDIKKYFGHFDETNLECQMYNCDNECETSQNNKPECYSTITGAYEICEKCSYNDLCVFRVKQKEMSPRRINNPVIQSETEESETKEETLCSKCYYENKEECNCDCTRTFRPKCFGTFFAKGTKTKKYISCRDKNCKYREDCRYCSPRSVN